LICLNSAWRRARRGTGRRDARTLGGTLPALGDNPSTAARRCAVAREEDARTHVNTLERRLRHLSPAVLRGARRGIEKESLRVEADGRLARTPHPAALGSALTHAHITTDFSESQLELITGAHTAIDDCLGELVEIHQFVYRAIGDELLWCASMPCRLPDEAEIPIGQYGRSNVGRTKTVYRQGLSHRYGKRMQTISGIHYNFSLPDDAWPLLQRADGVRGPERGYRDSGYFALIRNFRRHSWLLLYLFGASPATCRCFVEGRRHMLESLGSDSLYLPFATSLRMGPLGYQSEAQAQLGVSFNDLATYAASLTRGLTRVHPPYEAIGLRDGAGYRQLATTLLQIENEFYGTIRPKRRPRDGERPLRGLLDRGVEYVEVRCMDVDPFHQVGIDAPTMRFLDVFLLHCALAESPPDTPEETVRLARNLRAAAERGRDPELRLSVDGRETTPRAWGEALLAEFAPIGAALDEAHGGTAHRDALALSAARLSDPLATPSARMLATIRDDYGSSYSRFTLAQSQRHKDDLLVRAFDAAAEARQLRMAAESRAAQRQLEAADDRPFEDYRQAYLAQIS
jgi:glutamate--cysteine ligase